MRHTYFDLFTRELLLHIEAVKWLELCFGVSDASSQSGEEVISEISSAQH